MRLFVKHVFFVLVCLGTLGASCARAYTILDRDDVQMYSKHWQIETGAARFAYNLQINDEHSGEIHFQNLTAAEIAFRFRIDGYQRGIQNPEIQIQPGEIKSIAVKFSRVDQNTGSPHLSIVPPSEELADEPANTSEVIPKKGCFVTPYIEDINFNPRSLAYFIKRKDATTAELHFKNYTPQTIYFNFRILGYQPAMPDNPRVQLPAQESMELLIELPTMDNQAALGLVEIFNIRLDEDTGTLLSERKEPFQSHRIVKNRDWFHVAMMEDETANFNPIALVHRPVREGTTVSAIEFKNLGLQPVSFDFFVMNRQPADKNGNLRVTVPPGGITRAATTPFQALASEILYVLPSKIHVGPDSTAFKMTPPVVAHAISNTNWLHPVPFSETALFDPLTLGYLITPAENQNLKVTFKSTIATRISFDFQIMGYPASTAIPRVTLLPGQEFNLLIPVAKTDARAAIAKIKVSNMRIGGETRKLLMAGN